MKLSLMCPSTGGHKPAINTWIATMSVPREIVVDETVTGKAAGYLQKVQKFYEETDADVIAYLHSDLFIHEKDWDLRVLKEFEDPNVVLVSFFGAKQLGRPDIYTCEYDFRQLARADCYSHMRDWFNHGRHCPGEMDIAMIDSFSLIVRRSFLKEIGGWPVKTYFPSHCSDMWLCCMAARHKKRVRLVGIDCTHMSGGVRGDGRFNYADWQAEIGHTDAEMHAANHRSLYRDFPDVLPIKVA